MTGRDDWRTGEMDELMSAILRLRSIDEAESFFRDLCTLGELRDMAQRWAVVRLLAAGRHYADISRQTGASTATITRIASWLHHGEGGYQLMLERLGPDSASRLRQPAPLLRQPARRPRPRRHHRPAPPDDTRGFHARPSPTGDSEQGPARRADTGAAPRCRPRLRGARSDARRPGLQLRPRHPLRPDQRHRRIRR